MSEIKIENLDLELNNKKVLDDINLEINKGEYIGLIGPNGAGKSSLIKTILGFYKPSKGSIKTNKDLKIAYVPQNFLGDNTFSISVKEVISLGLEDMSFENKHKKLNKIKEALEFVDLKESILNENFLDLSGGQKQRVVICRALIAKPNFIIFDEAFSNMDIQTKVTVYDLLSKINEELKTTILFVSHEIDTIVKKCGRVICLNKHLHEGCHPMKFMEGEIIKDSSFKIIHHHHNHKKC